MSVTKLYGGAVELDFNGREHCYRVEGTPVPGVTTILQTINKPALIQWSANQASAYFADQVKDYCLSDKALSRDAFNQIAKEAKTAHRRFMKGAADIGTEVHNWAEAYVKHQPLPGLTTDEAKRGADAFAQWVKEHRVKVLASERRIFSKAYWFAGTCDLVLDVEGEPAVADLKTSSGIYPEMRLQTAAYQIALEEEKQIRFGPRWIVRVDKKTGQFEAKPFPNYYRDKDGFLAALELYRKLRDIENEAA